MPSDPFDGSPVSRRRFVELSAATGAVLALPGNATADVRSDAFTDEYEFVLNHTPEDYRVPTLVRFSEPTGPSAMESLLEEVANVHATSEPEPAAYGQLTTAEATSVADVPSASEFQFAPGSNPFWRIGYYPLGVFPEPRRSVDYIGFEQLKDGLAELEDRYPDRIRVKNVGRSPGHHNNVTDRPDPKGMYVAELTNFDSETPFEEKEKVFFSCSLHGLEMAGRETGARVLENVARGSEPDVIEDEEKVEPYLDDVVVIMGFVNPDGWVARNPQYDSGWQVGGPGADFPRVPAAPLHERGNAEVFDTNRQYPTVGYLRPSHYPAEPSGGPSETPAYVHEKVPDAAALVEFFRGYENLNYGADLHGGPSFNEFVLGLISQDQFDTRELHEVYEMCLNIDDVLEEALELWTTVGDLNREHLDGATSDDVYSSNFGFVPTEGFDYATIYDTIDYTVSGAFLDWMAHPEPVGLDMTTLDFEMSYNHMTGGNVYNPELFRMEVDGYRTVIRTITAFAVRNSDTANTDEQFSTRTESGGESVAYVTTGAVGTDEDALRCTSDDLRFDLEVVTEEVDARTYAGVLGPGTPNAPASQSHTFTAAEDANRLEATATWNEVSVQDNELYLEDANGNRLASSTNFNPIQGGEQIQVEIQGGEEYTLVIETWVNAVANYEIDASLQRREVRQTGDASDGGSDGGLTTRTESVTLESGWTESTFEVQGDRLHSLGVETHVHGLVADAELVNPDGQVVSEFEGVDEEQGRLGGKCGAIPEFVVQRPREGTWTFRLRNRLADAKQGEITVWTLSSPAPNPDPEEVVGYEQRDYEVTPFRFFEDYEAFVDDGGTMEPVTVQEVADGALLDGDGSPAYDHVVVIHGYGANGSGRPGDGVYGYRSADHPAEGFTTPGYTTGLDEYVDSGGNLVLTDAGLKLVPHLDNTLVDGSAVDDGAVQGASGYEVARFTNGKDLDHPLLTDARPIQTQLWKVAPLGYQAFNGASGQAPMFAIDEASLAAAGEAAVTTVAGSNRQGVVAASLTETEDSGRGVHLIGSLLPRATQSNVHAFGLLDYTVTFLGNLVFTSALGWQQVRDTGVTTRTYGRGDDWDLEGVEPVEPPAPELSATGSRDLDSQFVSGRQATRVDVTVETVSHEATVFDRIPDGWRLLERFSDAAVADAEAGLVRLFDREDRDDAPDADDTVGPDDGGTTFTYYVESPDGVEQSGSSTFGPGLAEGVDVNATDEFAGQSDALVVAYDL